MHEIIHELPELTFVLMAGLPGAGKTTLAFALGAALRWLVLDKDMYKALFVTMGMDGALASAMAYELSFEAAWNALVRQRLSIILDSSAQQHFILQRARGLAHSANAQLKVIFCTASSDVRDHRIHARSNGFSSLYVAPVIAQDDRSLFTHLPADTLVLDTERPLNECVECVLHYLRK